MISISFCPLINGKSQFQLKDFLLEFHCVSLIVMPSEILRSTRARIVKPSLANIYALDKFKVVVSPTSIGLGGEFHVITELIYYPYFLFTFCFLNGDIPLTLKIFAEFLIQEDPSLSIHIYIRYGFLWDHGFPEIFC